MLMLVLLSLLPGLLLRLDDVQGRREQVRHAGALVVVINRMVYM